jgi:hypothetical protein
VIQLGVERREVGMSDATALSLSVILLLLIANGDP